jgi:hypothetical protein
VILVDATRRLIALFLVKTGASRSRCQGRGVENGIHICVDQAEQVVSEQALYSKPY